MESAYSPTSRTLSDSETALAGRHVAFVGKLGGFNRREAQALVRQYGGIPVDVQHASLDLIVVGAEELPLAPDAWHDESHGDLLARAQQDQIEVLQETQLWERLGLVDQQSEIRQLYTPAMLAELLGIPKATVRKWHRSGLIMPVREVHRLPYFDFQEVITARRIAQLLAAGATPKAVANTLQRLAELVPDVERPLAQLAVIVEGRDVLLRDGEGLLDQKGQRRFDFDAGAGDDSESTAADEASPVTFNIQQEAEAQSTATSVASPMTSLELMDHAAELELDGRLEDAINAYRSAQLASPPNAEIHFMLAELLYRVGDTTAARERYYSALELDEDYVEARANLGCVLAETGQLEFAVAAFEGALARHPDYSDVLFHLARTLDELGRTEQSLQHWQRFLDLSPESPWAAEARDRLGLAPDE